MRLKQRIPWERVRAAPVVELLVVAHHQLQAQAVRARLAHRNRLRVAQLRHLWRAAGQRHATSAMKADAWGYEARTRNLVFLPRATALHIVIASAAAVASSSSDALDMGMAGARAPACAALAFCWQRRCKRRPAPMGARVRTRKVGDHRLEVEQRLQAALRNLGLRAAHDG